MNKPYTKKYKTAAHKNKPYLSIMPSDVTITSQRFCDKVLHTVQVKTATKLHCGLTLKQASDTTHLFTVKNGKTIPDPGKKYKTASYGCLTVPYTGTNPPLLVNLTSTIWVAVRSMLMQSLSPVAARQKGAI
jgi:hypothetical protein